jgi:F-type H+-transporting ATPase subunit delta
LSDVTVARNYAEVLFDLGERSGQTDRYYDLIDATAAAVEQSPQIEAVMMSPRIPKAEKARLLAAGLQDAAPREFVLFVEAVVKRGRQGILREMATELQTLLDVKQNRIRAGVTLARPVDERLRDEIVASLAAALGKDVIATFYTDPAILGGTVVRVGERIFDGSVRRRLANLRRHLIQR